MDCFSMDCKRGIFCARFVLIVLALTAVMIAAEGDNIALFLEHGSTNMGAVEMIYNALGFDKYKVIIVFLLGGLCAGSFCVDTQSRYIRAMLARTSLFEYSLSRFTVNFIAVVLATVIAFVLFAVIMLCIGVPLWGGYLNEAYYNAIAIPHPWLFLLMQALQFGVIAAACSGIGLLFSAYQQNTFVAIGICGLVFYAAVSYIPLGSIFNLLIILQMSSPLPAGKSTPYALTFIWGMLYPTTVYVICGILFGRKLEWRKRYGLI